MRNKGIPCLFFLLTIVGLGLRIGSISYGNFAFTFDVGRDLLAVEKIITEKKFTLLGPSSGIPGFFYTSWWYYFLLPAFFLSSGNPFWVVCFIALLGVLMIPLSFLLGKLIARERWGLILSALVSVSPFLISTSTQIWSPNLVPFFSFCLLFFYLLLVINKKIYLFPILGFLVGLIFELEMHAGFILLPALLLSFPLIRREMKGWGMASFLTFFGFLLAELPRFLFELRHNFLMTRSLLRFFSENRGEFLFFANWDRLILFRQIWTSSVGGNNNALSFFLFLFTLLSLPFLLLKSQKELKPLVVFSLLVVVLSCLELVFWPGDFWGHYLIALGPIFVFLLSLIFSFWQKSLLLFLFVFFIILSPSRVLRLFSPPSWEGDAAVFRNQIAVVDYVYHEARGDKFNYIAYTPPLIDYTWRYLFSWHGRKKYGYSPSQSPQKLFFLILEPDYQMPGRRERWLEERKGDGKIVKREKVKGGIEVEIRIR